MHGNTIQAFRATGKSRSALKRMNLRNFWDEKQSFDGSAGMGCGQSLLNSSTFALGVGYWVTSQISIAFTDQIVGVSPKFPIPDTLYKCVENQGVKSWQAYYTPFTYPHPLRSDPFIGDELPVSPGSEASEDSGDGGGGG